jgi:hypothetical protein
MTVRNAVAAVEKPGRPAPPAVRPSPVHLWHPPAHRMTALLCAVCSLPLGDVWAHYPHEPSCANEGMWHYTGGPMDCDCPTPPVHPACCPCQEQAA